MSTPEAPDPAASRTLRFVNVPEDAREDAIPTVVLDTAWTPGPATPDWLLPVRPTVLRILDRTNLHVASLDALDAWAADLGLADACTHAGVTWWFHARSFVRLELHELMLWGRVLDELAPRGRYGRFLVPEDRPLLAAAIEAGGDGLGPRVELEAGTPFATSDVSGKPAIGRPVAPRPAGSPAAPGEDAGAGVEPADTPSPAASVRHPVIARLRAGLRRALRPTSPDRRQTLARLRRHAASPGGVLAIVRPASFHRVLTPSGPVQRDPYVGAVTERLEAAGHPATALALGAGARRKAYWALVRSDERLLPHGVLGLLPGAPGPGRVEALRSEAAARLAALPPVPLPDGDRDLGPALGSIVGGLGPWLASQWAEMDRAGRLLAVLRPGVLLTGWEAARTAWLGAARRHGIPSVAIQHGVIYPSTPDYRRPDHPALVRPDITCVFGEYERGILLEEGGYPPDAVVATGSPRTADGAVLRPLADEDRLAIRRELGVADGDRMLVVSGGRMTIGDRLGTLPLLGRVLDGPLPGVHVVVKLHPEEGDTGHYRALLEGQAHAAGYPVPPITVVRHADIYRLLGAADAHLGVLSTVLTDAVLAGTPNLIVVGQGQADLIGYVAAGVATPVRTVDDVRAALADPRPPDPERRRRFIEAHYVPGDAADRIATIVAGRLARRRAG